jgi:hypothetical protein
MTNNNNTSPVNCACGQLSCASFVAGNQCFRCEQVDNQRAGIIFTDEQSEHAAWFRQVDKRIVEHKAGPHYIDSSGYAYVSRPPRCWPGTPDRTGAEPYGQWNNG